VLLRKGISYILFVSGSGSLSEGGLAGLTAPTYFSTSSACCASSLYCNVLEAALIRSAVQLFRSFTSGMCFLGKEFLIYFLYQAPDYATLKFN
jgi:hypothetical protein